jgi:hypothetical protein
MLRFWCTGLALLGGCAGTPPAPADAALFDARDAIVDPRDAIEEARGDAPDVEPVVDVQVFDLLSPDAPAADAAARDTAARDTAASDGGPSGDAPPSPCADLAERYAATVREGQACAGSNGCEVRVCETLCCACDVFISGSPERMRALDDLRDRATSLGCGEMMACPTVRCPPARRGTCSADGRCVTLRDPPDASAPPDAPRDR